MSSTPLDAKEICQNDKFFKVNFGQKYILSTYRFFEYLFNKNWQKEDEDYCMRAVQNMAFVEVQYASDTVSQTKRDVRYTFAGILSNLG